MLPKIISTARKPLLLRLLLNGFGQALLGFGLALLTRQVMHEFKLTEQVLSTGAMFSILGFVMLAFVLLALRVLQSGDAERLGQSYTISVRLKLFRRLAVLPLRSEKQARYGLTMTRMITDLNSLKNWVSVGVARVIVATVSLIGALLALAYFSVLAALTSAVLLSLCVLAGLCLTPFLRQRVRQARRCRGQLAACLGEKVVAMTSIMQFAQIEQERKRLRAQSQRVGDAMVKRMLLAGMLRALAEVTLPLLSALFIALAAFDYLPIEELVVALLLSSMMSTALRDLAQAWDYRQSFSEAKLRLQTLLALPRRREPKNPAPLPDSVAVSVRFEKIKFANICKQLSISANAGERILLSGHSAAGKTSLLQLCAGLCVPARGQVLLNGHPLHQYAIADVRRIVQLVCAQSVLWRGTVSDNIAYGLTKRDQQVITEIAVLCGLSEQDHLLATGLNHRVDEQGKNLASSVRSRIALARALAHKPKLLLIDDANFVLDAKLACLLNRVLQHYAMTAIIVGPETMATINIDKIWRLQNGHIEAQYSSTAGADIVPMVSA